MSESSAFMPDPTQGTLLTPYSPLEDDNELVPLPPSLLEKEVQVADDVPVVQRLQQSYLVGVEGLKWTTSVCVRGFTGGGRLRGLENSTRQHVTQTMLSWN